MSFIIVTRNPKTKRLVVIADGDDERPAEFDSYESAIRAAIDTPVCQAWSYQIIAIDN